MTSAVTAFISLNRFLGPVDDYVTTKPPVTKSQRLGHITQAEAAGVPASVSTPVTGAAADEYNLNVVDCNVSVTVARRSSISV